jgi:hypothetical protein
MESREETIKRSEIPLPQRVFGYAKDKNDFFCVHEVAMHLSEDQRKVTECISKFVGNGYFTKSEYSSCKMLAKKHPFYIWNKGKEYEYKKKTVIHKKGKGFVKVDFQPRTKQKITILGQNNKILLSLEFEGEFKIDVPPINEPIYSITIEKVNIIGRVI